MKLLLEDFEGDLTYFNAHGNHAVGRLSCALGQHYPGSCATLVGSGERPWRGHRCGELSYHFQPGVEQVHIKGTRQPKLSVCINKIGLWVRGDGSGHELCFKVGSWVWRRQTISWEGWREVSFEVGGRQTLENTAFEFYFMRGNDERLEGKIALDDLYIETTEEAAAMLPVLVRVTGARLAHLWDLGETAELNVRVTHRLPSRAAYTLETTILDGTGEKLAESQAAAFTLEPWESDVLPLRYAASRFGLYAVNYRVRDAGRRGVQEGRKHFGFAAAAAKPSGEARIGVVTHFLRFGEEREIALLKRAGVRWARTETDWFGFVRRPGAEPDWDYYRSLYRQARIAGIQCLGNPAYPPAFTNGVEAYGQFIESIVSHLKEEVKHWEILNEPNSIFFFPGPLRYAVAHVKAGVAAMRRADPQAVAIAPGLAHMPVDYLAQALDAGLAGHMDKLSFHPYGTSWQEWPRWLETLDRHGLKGIDQWVTEDSEPNMAPGGLTRRAARWRSRGIEKWFVYDLRDDDYYGTPDLCTNMGMLEGDFTVKSAFLEFITLVRMLDGTEPAADLVRLKNIEGAEFLRADTSRVGVVWTEEKKPVEVSFTTAEGSLCCMDIYGNKFTTPVENGGGSLAVSPTPIYLVDLPGDLQFRQDSI